MSAGAAVPATADDAADDAALVAAAVAGSHEAFDSLVTRHRRAVYQLCFRYVHHHDDAADLTQDTFVRAWKALPTFRGQARFTTWLYRIAVNVSLNRVALRAPAVEPLESDGFEDRQHASPSDALLEAERAAQVRAAIAALPPRQRTVLVLRAYHELSHQEVAEIVGTSVGAVKANVFHALANLRKRLGGRS